MSFLSFLSPLAWGKKKEDSPQEEAEKIVKKIEILKSELYTALTEMKVDIERRVATELTLKTNADGSELILVKGKCFVKFSLVKSNRPTVDILMRNISGDIKSQRLEISRDLNYTPLDLKNFKRAVITFIDNTQRGTAELRA